MPRTPHHLHNPFKLLRSNQIALDVGSGFTRVASAAGDILLNEPSVIAQELATGETLAIGTEAKSFLGKTPERIQVVRPVENGVILDFDAAKELLRQDLAVVLPDDGRRVAACVVAPQSANALERRTIVDCCKNAGVSRCDLVGAPLAAAVGAGMDIRKSKGLLLLGVGHGLAEASLICLGDVVQSASDRVAGQSFREAVARQLASLHHIFIGENMAEQIVMRLAWAVRPEEPHAMTVSGKDIALGTPASVKLTEDDLDHALDGPLDKLEALVRGIMEKAPAELVADIAETGLNLYGGGAQLTGLDRFLGQRLGLQTQVLQDPALTAVRGAAAALRDRELLRLMVR